MENIGTKITEIRKLKGLSQEALSNLAKINLRTLQRIEKNETKPHGETLIRLCNVLDIKIENVLEFNKKEDLTFIRFFHLSVLTFVFIPLGNIILPLVLWLTKRDKIVSLNDQGIEVLNFQILWSLIFYSFLMVFGWFKIKSIDGSVVLIYILGMLFLINIFYPILVFFSIKNGQNRKHYYRLIQFIKK